MTRTRHLFLVFLAAARIAAYPAGADDPVTKATTTKDPGNKATTTRDPGNQARTTKDPAIKASLINVETTSTALALLASAHQGHV